jgi:hypothetical protein
MLHPIIYCFGVADEKNIANKWYVRSSSSPVSDHSIYSDSCVYSAKTTDQEKNAE